MIIILEFRPGKQGEICLELTEKDASKHPYKYNES